MAKVTLLLSGIILFGAGYLVSVASPPQDLLTPLSESPSVQLPSFDRYSIESLHGKTFQPSSFSSGKTLDEDARIRAVVISFITEGKRVSGVLTVPKAKGTYPVIVLFRGFVPREKYSPAEGTKRVGEALARAGFITIAPDFLGYGESASPSAYPMEERFETYTTALTLIASVKHLSSFLPSLPGIYAQADGEKIGIWGHSNGGHIALVTLETSGKYYPTVLWAPVSAPFPFSILYYTDEYDDHGKALRRVVSDFEKNHDAEKFSLTNYLHSINAPIQLHQGGRDDAVPQKWSDGLYKMLSDLGKDVTYYTYPGDDHNLAKGGWNTAVTRTIALYKKTLE